MHVTEPPAISEMSHRTVVGIFVATTFVASSLLFLRPTDVREDGAAAPGWQPRRLEHVRPFLPDDAPSRLPVHASDRSVARCAQASGAAPAGDAVGGRVSSARALGDATPAHGSSPIRWLLTTLFVRLGLPFFALSTMAPLVQRWFATLAVPSASNPYFLYAASNIGSLLALLSYPFLLEPLWGTRTQTVAWAVGYGVLLVLTAACALQVRLTGATFRKPPTTASPPGRRGPAGRHWRSCLRA